MDKKQVGSLLIAIAIVMSLIAKASVTSNHANDGIPALTMLMMLGAAGLFLFGTINLLTGLVDDE